MKRDAERSRDLGRSWGILTRGGLLPQRTVRDRIAGTAHAGFIAPGPCAASGSLMGAAAVRPRQVLAALEPTVRWTATPRVLDACVLIRIRFSTAKRRSPDGSDPERCLTSGGEFADRNHSLPPIFDNHIRSASGSVEQGFRRRAGLCLIEMCLS